MPAGRAGILAVIVAGAAFLLAACQPEESGLPPVGDELMAIQKAQCEADGDIWGEAGAQGTFICFRRTPDADKSCSSASDCTGACLARSRTCSPLDPLIGCQEVLTASGTRATLCVD